MSGINLSGTYGTVSARTPVVTRTSWKDGRSLGHVRRIGDIRHGAVTTYGSSFHPDARDVEKAFVILRDILSNPESSGATITRDYLPAVIPDGLPVVIGGVDVSMETIIREDDAVGLERLALRLHRYIVSAPSFIGRDTAVGIWYEPGNGADLWTFDIVDFHAPNGEAIRIARERGQRAVYDSFLGRCITV
jgi:hypothetical protein